ncbi:MAG: hypothetical protein SWK90_12020 [Chloroflexota bacterium]|nr:hypothetical protein [Chloroflexota bacterium]
MKRQRQWILVSVLALGLLLALAAGLALAQGPEPPEGEVSVEGEVSAAAAVDSKTPVQGRLTDDSGNPLNGTYTINFYLYDALTGGNLVCDDDQNNDVPVSNGLFTWEIWGDCGSNDLTGLQLYLEIRVEGETLSPRQPIYPVPYAFSLRPGAIISGTSDGILTVRSTGSGDSDAFVAYAGGTGEAVTASATEGVAVAAFSDDYLGLQAYSYDTANDHPGIFGCSADSSGTCDPYRDDNGAGVMGYSQYDYGGYFVGGTSADGGVYAEANYSLGMGVWAENKGGGAAVYAEGDAAGGTSHIFPTLYLVQADSAGDFVVGSGSIWGTRYWRVDRTGRGFFNGGTQASGADFAEQMAVEGEEVDYEPGDVLIISGSADRMVELSVEPFATAVIGVYSTEPGVLAGAPDTDDPLEGIPVAITGIVPCKVSAENGAIHRGDLLVTSSTSGHAMRAEDNPPQGTVLGKALGELAEGTGIIEILVTLQ